MTICFKTATPPRKFLEGHKAYAASDTPFRGWCRLQQSLYREAMGWACGVERGKGGAKGRELGNYLTDEDAQLGRNFLSPLIHDYARDRLFEREPGDVIEDRRLRYNMLTSQALCFNLFIPQLANPKLATAIWRTLMPRCVAEVKRVKLEHSPGRAHPTLGIGDQSAFDAFVEYVHCDGGSGCLGIETKYTDSFSSTVKKPTERIEKLIESTGLFTKDGWEQLNHGKETPAGGRRPRRFMPTQQLWRTHLLAETMRGKPYRHVTYMVLCPEGDAECAGLLPKYKSVLAHHPRPEDLFGSMTLEAFVSTVQPILTGRDAEWLDAFHARYLDWEPVEGALSEWKAVRN